MSLEATGCLKGLVEGVLLEVLWDVEIYTEEGRRSGGKITESVWWRTKVLEVSHEGGSVIAKVRYDSMHGFKSQTGRLYVFPLHVQPVGENEITQLRWRFFESSGNVSYDISTEGNDMLVGGSLSLSEEDGKFSLMQCRLDGLSGRIQSMERLARLRHAEFSLLSSSPGVDDNRMEDLLAVLRQKLAFNAQKPLPSSKARGRNQKAPALIDHDCTGSIRAGIDFSADEFEALCKLIHRKGYTSRFRADNRNVVPSSGVLKASTGVAEVLFGSLNDLCEALRITEQADRINIALQKKVSMSIVGTDDVALRVCGTFLSDKWKDNAPSMILVCGGLYEDFSMHSEMCVLSRKSTELDPQTAWYRKPLNFERLTASEMLGALSKSTDSEQGMDEVLLDTFNAEYWPLLRRLRSQTGCFALRWKPLPGLRQSMWTRKICNPSHLYGTLEVEIPYILIRGSTPVSEVENALTTERMQRLIN